MPRTKDSQDLDKSYLTALSPADSSFDSHKSAAVEVAELYQLDTGDGYEGFLSGNQLVYFGKMATKIERCGAWLRFVQGQERLKLVEARFCKSPNCPMCQWRRSLKWRAKFLSILPMVQEQFPTHRWIFLTFTLKNCQLSALRSEVKKLNTAFNRLSKLSKFPMEGCVKSVEVTRSWDCYDAFTGKFLGRHGSKWIYHYQQQHNTAIRVEPTDEVHPHLHVVGMVKASYFTRNYLKHSEWREMWRRSARVDYDPMVNVQTVKCKKGQKLIPTADEFSKDNATDTSGMISAICETLKYTVKEQDLIGEGCEDKEANSLFLKQITEQLYKMRRVEYRGVLKEIGRELEEAENGDLVNINDEDKEPEAGDLEEVSFKWVNALGRYVKVKTYDELIDQGDIEPDDTPFDDSELPY
ncbi:protein rep [Picosynechococcus sp. NKBG042902]|uniref:protein rep n=1 Tax=Picosynechococcus sp. NKBG042902 TaxID=490193 RepID=UPI0004AACAFE|nr:protein rep [Picosynechococcus sp. NKBG042902]